MGRPWRCLQFDGFFAGDIAAYKKLFKLPDVPIQTQLLNGYDGAANTNNSEVALDIEMTIAMAPGLDAVIVYEGTEANSILGAIAAPPIGVPLSNQASSSWDYSIDDNTRQTLEEMAVQGQSFSDASGDNGAFSCPIPATTAISLTRLSLEARCCR